MFYKYRLNINTNWNLLPWKKLYSRLISIQHKIYKFTKEYSFNLAYKWQKYLLNAIEIKVISIKYITDQIYLYSNINQKLKYNISDKDKFYLLKFLYIPNNKNKTYFFYEKIKLYLIYLSIKPEWDAKFSSLSSYKLNIYRNSCNHYLNNPYIKNINDKLYNINLSNHSFFVSILRNKISLLKYVKYDDFNISYKYNLSLSTIYKTSLQLFLSEKFNIINEIYFFFFRICILGLDWYLFYITRNIKSVNTSINTNNDLVKNIKCQKKQLLFYITYFNIYKIMNTYNFIKNKQIYNNSDIIYINFLINFCYLLSYLFIKINFYIYYYTKKTHKNIFFNYYNLRIKNICMNKLFYEKQVNCIYLGYLKLK